ncbi:CdaR family protein [Tepidimicrobium xylanilyticum]
MGKEKNNDLTLKIFALIIAIILWSYVMSEVNPPFENEFKNVSVEYINEAALERQGLVVMEPQKATIRVTISGRRSEVLKVSEKDIIAQVDLSGYSEGEQKVPVYVQVPDDVKIVDYSPKEILFRFDKIIRKSSPVVVETQGKLAQGYVLATPEIKPESIYIQGPRTWVNLVAKAIAYVDVSNKAEDINTTVAVKIVDDEGNDVRGVTMEQSVVDVFIPVYQVKKVPIELQTENQLPDNYEIVEININPSTIEIKGRKEDLAKVNLIKTKPIDINVLIDNRNIPVELELPEGVSLLRPDEKVIITLNVDEKISRTFGYTLEDVDIVNLDSNLIIDENDFNKTIMVTVEGMSSKINSLNKEDIDLTMDLKDLDEGTHRVNVDVSVEEGITVVTLVPEGLNITLIKE